MSNKILLCISNTGGGHLSAANAIRKAIDEVVQKGEFEDTPYETVIADVVEDSNLLNRLFVGLYNYLLRYQQGWMKYYFRFIQQSKPDDSAPGYWLAFAYINRLLRRVNPVVVVSVHPMANHYLARALKAIKLQHRPKLILVVIDPNAELWVGWACKEADLIIVPNDLASHQLISLGVQSSRIVTVGMPVDPKFLHPPLQSREAFLTKLGLKPSLVTVCLSAGWAGGGNFVDIYLALAKVSRSVQVLFICGNNAELYKKIEQLSQDMTFSTAVVPELPSLSDAMSACDLLVTKAGGLTTFEAVARRLPMAIDMLTEPMPQESGTAEMLIDAGLAKPIYYASDIVGIVESLEHIDNRDKLPLPKMHNLDRTDAVYEIAKIILSNCHTKYEPNKFKEAA